MRRRGASIVAAICFSVLAALSLVGWSFVRAELRPAVARSGAGALPLPSAEHSRLQRRVILLVPLLVLWANVHGSVLLGACLSCLYALYRAARMGRERAWRDAGTYVGLALIVAATPLATPYGVHILHCYAEFVGNKAMRAAATEWDPRRSARWPCRALPPTAAGARRADPELAPAGETIRVPIGFVAITAVSASLESGSIVWASMARRRAARRQLPGDWLPTRAPSPRFLGMITASGLLLTFSMSASPAMRSDRLRVPDRDPPTSMPPDIRLRASVRRDPRR